MKKQTLSAAIAATILLTNSQVTFAEDKPGFSGSGEASFSNSTGNTKTEALYAALKTNYKQDSYKLEGLLEANNDKQDGIQTKERYVADVQADVLLPDYPKAYGFGQVRLENDRFESVDLSSYYVIGGGYQFFDEKTTSLSAEAGLGYHQVNYSSKSSTKDIGQGVLKLKANYTYQINDTTKFTQDASEYYGSKQAKFESNSAITVQMMKALSLKATYKFRHNNAPSDGKDNVDTEFVIGVIYNF